MSKSDNMVSLVHFGPPFLLVIAILFTTVDSLFDLVSVEVFVVGWLCICYLIARIYWVGVKDLSPRKLNIIGWLGWAGVLFLFVGWIVYQWYAPL